MLRRSFFYLVFLSSLFSKAFAQVNLQNGNATFSLPVFNWNDDKSRLNSLIALSYNSGNGLKINDIPSNVGQNWSLVCGGVVTRMQAGEPDDQVARNGNGTEYDITRYPAGILYATTPAANGCPTALTKYPIYGWKNQLYTQHQVLAEDKQLDYFSFMFNGKTGLFVLDPTNIGVAHSLGDTKMKITFQQDGGLQSLGIRTKITSFSIQDLDGLIYKFARHGLTKVLQSNYCDANLVQSQTQPKFKNDKVYHQSGFDNGVFVNPWVIGSWYLTEIEDALTHRKVFLNYITRNINSLAGEDIMYNLEKDYSIIYHKRSITQTPALTSIVYPDGHTATLNYGSARIDLTGDYVLSSIDITYNGRYLSRHELNTTYVMRNRYGTPVSDYQKKVARLYLKSVRKIGPDLKEDSPPYIFDYYLGSNTADDIVPPRFFYAKDIWGFYNGDNSKGYWLETIPLDASLSNFINNQLRGLCFMRNGVSGVVLNAKSGYAKNGLLRQIIYPTGGTLTYEYEQNTGVVNGSTTNVGGVHVSQTSSTDGGYSNSCANPIITKYHYVMNGVGSASSLWGIETPVNSTFSQSHYQPEYKYYKWAGCFPFGCCDWKFKYPGILSQQQAISLTDFQKFMEAVAPILEIISIISTIADVVTAVSGGNPVALIIDIIVGLVQLAVTCIGSQERDNNYTVYHNFDLNSAAPLPTQFKRVEVEEASTGFGGGVGKTVQEFTSSDDYPLWVAFNPNFTSKQRFASWAYGLPKLTTVYDVNGNKVKETQNVYDYLYAKSIIGSCGGHPGQPCNPSGLLTNIVSCKCVVTKSYSQRNTNWSDPVQYNNPATYLTASNSDLKVDYYAMYTGRTNLATTYERIYKPASSQYLETVSNNVYHPTNHQLTDVSVTESNGKTSFKHFTYSIDYYQGVFATMNENNILYDPVSIVTGITSPGYGYNGAYSCLCPDYFVLEESVTEYVQTSNGNIKPSRKLEQRFNQPTPFGIAQPGGGWLPGWQAYAGPVFTNYNLYKQPQTFIYDPATSNLTGLKDEGNRIVTNIYGYNDKYLVASVINADPVSDKTAHASFEETSTWSGWTLNGSPISYTTLYSVTGARSFVLSSSASFTASSLNTSKPYILSFWSGAVLSIAGGTLIKTGPTLSNGLTYYEYDVPQGTASVTVNTSSGAVIDELRLYPKTARMRSVTYDPVIGKTSECDENNRLIYYEYDNLGRLRFVKDGSKNIVKMYEYNNISPAKQNGCPGNYYNRMASEVFTKSNCGPGYIGGNVTYTVPANIYSSAISQADADAQAENNLLTNGQAYANTNGTCTPIYYNAYQAQNFTTENCLPGYIGGVITYSVPAGRYSSLISQLDADEQALDEIESNGQAYANDPAHQLCYYNFDPEWIWLEGADWYCNNGHLYVLETDVNPNSSSYNQTRWSDVGESELCPYTPNDVILFYENNTGDMQYVYMLNNQNSNSYYFYMYPYTNGMLGSVQEGDYSIDISDSYPYNWHNYEAGCWNWSSGTYAYFFNIPINSSCNTIRVY